VWERWISITGGAGTAFPCVHDTLTTGDMTCLKRFTRYGHYTGEVEDIIIVRLAIVIAVPKIRPIAYSRTPYIAFSCGLMTLC